MKQARIRTRKSALALAAALALGAWPIEQAQAATCTWNATNGNWNEIAKWLACVAGNGNPAGSPGSLDTANIGGTGVVTVNTTQTILNLNNAGVINVDAASLTLQSGGSTNNTGGAINIANASTLFQNGQTITGGTITTTGTGRMVANASTTNFLSGVTLNGLLDMSTAVGFQRVVNGLTLGGSISINNNSVLAFQDTNTVSGGGTIVLGGTGASNRIALDGTGTTTFGAGLTVRGQNGTIGNSSFVGGAQTLVNNGTISADVSGGTITIAGSPVTNNGTMSALNGGTLVLASNVTGNPGGQIVAGAGSTVLQSGVTLSGTINTSGSGRFAANASTVNFLNGVTLNGNLDLATATGFQRVSAGGLVLNGTVDVNNNSVLAFTGDGGLSGSGTVVLGNTGASNRIALDGDGTTTFAAGTTVRGQNGTIGNAVFVSGTQALVNNGTISADVAGGTITIVTSPVTNNGTMSALNGGTLVLASNVTGNPSGQIVAGAGSTVLQSGVTLSGTINTSGSGRFAATASSNNFLSGVTLNGNLDLATATGFQRVTAGGLVLNGTVDLNNNSVLAFTGDGGLSGGGTVVLGGTGASNRIALDGTGTTTFAAGTTVRGQNGTIGNAVFVGGTQALVNNGTISADVSGGTITIAGSPVTNGGTMSALNGGTLVLASDVTGNPGGQIVAGAGSTVLQSGVTLSGTINTSGSGRFAATGSSNNVLSGVTLNGNLDLATATGFERVTAGGLVLNGTININNNSVLAFNGDGGLSGSATVVLGNTGASNRIALDGTGTTTFAAGTTVRGQNGTIGNAAFTGGTQTLVNNGTINSDSGGTIAFGSSALVNNGLVRAQTGTMNVSVPLSGTGTLQVDSAGVMNLAAGAKTQGQLVMGATGAALNVNTGNLTITGDYTNVGAGIGNAFNRRAGVTGTGQIVAAADAAQAITGAAVTNGATTSATLTIGNVRVGANDFAYQIGNTGSTGPTLRGAVQTSVNGGNLTDARLSGSGVAATNYNAGAPAGSGETRTVTFTAATAGALAPLTGQVLNLRSNFENIADQKLNIVLGSGAAAYNAAVGSAAPSPVMVANQHVGGSTTAALTVSNTAAAGAFTEGLNASFGANTGAATNNGGSIGLLAGGASNGTAMRVGVDTSTAGAKSGTVLLDYQTDGAGTSGLAAASAGSQSINVTGNVYRLAQANVIAPIDFGNVLAGSTQTRTLTISNLAIADGFSEALNAAFGTVAGTNAGSFSTSGAINGLLAGSSDNTTMTVTLNTSTTGTRTATVQILLDSNGTAIGNGLGLTALPTQTINLDGVITGTVGSLASAGLSPTTVDFGKFREGTVTSQSQQLTISNLTTGPGEGLNASFGASSGGASNNGGSIASLATGASNASAMVVSLGGLATAGAKSGSQVVNFVSDGTFNAGVTTTLPSQSVGMTAEVYRLAQANVAPTVALAARRVGDAAATGALSIGNSAAADGFSEGLIATVGAAPAGFAVSGPASTGLLAAGTGTTRTVSLATGTSGTFAGVVNTALVSNGAGTSGFGDLAIGSQSTAVSGKVYAAASGSVITSSVDFGVVRVGDTVSAQNITVQNVAAATALDDTMRASLAATGPYVGGGPITGIMAGGSGAIGIGLNTSTAGVFNTTASLAFLSQNADMADVSAGGGSVSLTAQVNNLANADFDLLAGLGTLTQSGTDYVLDFGTLTLGSMASALLQLDNDVSGPADLLSGGFGFLDTLDFLYGGWTGVSNLAAGSASGGLSIDFSAIALGLYTDAIEFAGVGTNASDPTGLAQTRRLLVRANVIDSGGTVPEPGSLALALGALVIGTVLRRRRQRAG